MTALLFAYGTLIPRDVARFRREGWVPDAVRGRLYDLGPHPALIDLDDPAAGWVHGFVRPVEMAELEGQHDAYEEVEKGLFRRAQTTTRAGRIAWIYVFSGPLPPNGRGPIDRWTPPEAGVAPPGASGVGDHDGERVDSKESKA
jgi:gamma-glutamylcyclotransferase (GGCT)/AIG2-like uncharacterized protein YtfP